MNYNELHKFSILEKEKFWEKESRDIFWNEKFNKVLDYSDPPFAKWFLGGQTNLCFNAIDRHLSTCGDNPAITYISTETNIKKIITYNDLYRKVNVVSKILISLGVCKGDRVLIYMPIIPEAVYSMLACARIGAVHSVVFGGFASKSLANRIDDAKPKLMITSDAGIRGGKVIPYKQLIEGALKFSKNSPKSVLIKNRGLIENFEYKKNRDFDFDKMYEENIGETVKVQWLESNEPSYILYTSGTTGVPKGIQRDVGGHAVALSTSMKYIYCGKKNETIFTTSDIGWVVGHSYMVYAPLIMGMNSILYEGLPINPDPSIWWRIVEEYKVKVMFSSPTAIRVLRKHDVNYIKKYDISCLKHLFLAGEPLDEPTHKWASSALNVPVIDHFWQTETGWPILTSSPGIEKRKIKYGSPSFPAYGYDVKILGSNGKVICNNEKGVLTINPPLPPGCMTTVWGNDKRFVDTYFSDFKEKLVYSTFDWAIRDNDGYYFILGRTDDVINVAGHRLGTREIEESVQTHNSVAEVAVVGVKDKIKGQMPVSFVVLKPNFFETNNILFTKIKKEITLKIVNTLGPIAKPRTIYFVKSLPKTRSGKLLRRSIQALCESRDPGDLTTLEDGNALEEIKVALDKQ